MCDTRSPVCAVSWYCDLDLGSGIWDLEVGTRHAASRIGICDLGPGI